MFQNKTEIQSLKKPLKCWEYKHTATTLIKYVHDLGQNESVHNDIVATEQQLLENRA